MACGDKADVANWAMLGKLWLDPTAETLRSGPSANHGTVGSLSNSLVKVHINKSNPLKYMYPTGATIAQSSVGRYC